MFAVYQAPKLSQPADETILLEIAAVVVPGFLVSKADANGLAMRMPGDYLDRSLDEAANNRFQVLLGALRAWRPIAGQRRDEVGLQGIGPGPVLNETGSMALALNSGLMHATAAGEVEAYAQRLKVAMDRSEPLRNALWLFGRRDRNAADYYMIYEYAEQVLGGRKQVVERFALSDNEVTRLTKSANNLAPLKGGRHASASGVAEWGIEEQKGFVATLLRRWIELLAA